MRNKSTPIVLAALLCIFGYFGWEHFKTKKNPENKFKKLPKQDRIDLAIAYEFELTKDPALNIVPRERLIAAEISVVTHNPPPTLPAYTFLYPLPASLRS